MIVLLQITGECDSERILKIGEYLAKLCVDYAGLLFLAHPVFSLAWIAYGRYVHAPSRLSELCSFFRNRS